METGLKDFSQYAPLTLAFLGDAVYSLAVRAVFVQAGDVQVEKLHRRTASVVSAPAQAKSIRALLPSLTEEEMAVYRRGRNAKPYHMAKNASREDYLEATGFEALLGLLYLQGKMERLKELIREGVAICGLQVSEEEMDAALLCVQEKPLG